ncbi:hypothetical protein L1049_004090 [Liquidambar formosana]|uniref:LOB domain-containing protein n=1 Tax=Liquidambar formosana TaxID=63359 RepID=A0AAP0RSP0_LIQFO
MSLPGVGNDTTQACAACKYQRRECTADCILAPYFPHDCERQFLNAYKLFGVLNIMRIIHGLEPPEKDEAMRTIIIQSDVRANDPVGGCYRIIRELQRQIEFSKAELDLVLHQLAICRAQSHHKLPPQDDSTLDCHVINADPLSSYNPHHRLLDQDQYVGNIVRQNHHLQDLNLNAGVMENSMPSPLHVKKTYVVDECDDIKPLLEIPDERNELNFKGEETVDRAQAFLFEINLTRNCSDQAVLNEDKVILKEENASIQTCSRS